MLGAARSFLRIDMLNRMRLTGHDLNRNCTLERCPVLTRMCSPQAGQGNGAVPCVSKGVISGSCEVLLCPAGLFTIDTDSGALFPRVPGFSKRCASAIPPCPPSSRSPALLPAFRQRPHEAICTSLHRVTMRLHMADAVPREGPKMLLSGRPTRLAVGGGGWLDEASHAVY